MEKPHPDYSVYSDQMEYKVDKFLALHDTLTKGNYEFVTTSPYTQRVSCKLSISDFHKRTDRSFDFAFVEANCEFVLDHLKNNIDAMKSLNFLESIVTLGEIARKDFYILFPEIEKHYKRIENENKRIENERRKENDIGKHSPSYSCEEMCGSNLVFFIRFNFIFPLLSIYCSHHFFLKSVFFVHFFGFFSIF